jgi:transposase
LSVRELTRWLCTRPEDLTTDETSRLTAILDDCPQISALAGHIRSFAVILTHRTGDRDLNPWIAAVTDDGHPELMSFARGLLADYDAVRAGLTLPYSSGAVEGQNCRVKMIKRKLYGRANLDLLRKLVILGP